MCIQDKGRPECNPYLGRYGCKPRQYMSKKLWINTIHEWDSGTTYQYVTHAPAQVCFNFYPDDENVSTIMCTAADYEAKREKTASQYELALGGVRARILDRGGQVKVLEFGGDNSSPLSIDISCEIAEKSVQVLLGQMRFWRQGSEPPAWQW